MDFNVDIEDEMTEFERLREKNIKELQAIVYPYNYLAFLIDIILT